MVLVKVFVDDKYLGLMSIKEEREEDDDINNDIDKILKKKVLEKLKRIISNITFNINIERTW